MSKRASALLFVLLLLTPLRGQNSSGLPVAPSVVPPALLTNVSCRAYVVVNSNVAIAGFVVTGQPGATIQVLIRGVGPTLAKFGVSSPLAQPQLTVYDSSNKQLAANSSWGTNSDPLSISAAAISAGAFALPQGSADCALLLVLAPGSYTAVVSGLKNSMGVALVEVYGVPASNMMSPPVPSQPPTTEGAGIG